MKKLICVIALSGMVSAGLVSPPVGKATQPLNSMLITTVLQAHNFPQGPEAVSSWMAEAVKVTAYNRGSAAEGPDFFQRQVWIATDGYAYKRHKAHPLGVREQFDTFDGKESFRSVVQMGVLAEEATPLTGSEFENVKFGVNTFGLIPILRQIANPEAEAYVATTERRDVFKVTTNAGTWTLYTDQSHLVRRVEMQNLIIEYGDYHSVEGIQLPFFQRCFLRGQLFYELSFSRIDVNAKFSPDFFSHSEARAKVAI